MFLYLCSQDLLKDPKSCPDGHCFCSGCVGQLLDMNQGSAPCPNDRRPLTRQSLRPVLNISGLVENLQVRCSTTEGNAVEEGRPSCDWTGPLGRLGLHLRDECQFEMAPCPNVGCGTRVRRQRLEEHQAQFSHRLVPCQHCQNVLQFANMTMHSERECPALVLVCPYVCGDRIER